MKRSLSKGRKVLALTIVSLFLLGAATQKARSTKYITAFMKYHLEGNAAYRSHLYGAEHKKDAAWFLGYAHNMDF